MLLSKCSRELSSMGNTEEKFELLQWECANPSTEHVCKMHIRRKCSYLHDLNPVLRYNIEMGFGNPMFALILMPSTLFVEVLSHPW